MCKWNYLLYSNIWNNLGDFKQKLNRTISVSVFGTIWLCANKLALIKKNDYQQTIDLQMHDYLTKQTNELCLV